MGEAYYNTARRRAWQARGPTNTYKGKNIMSFIAWIILGLISGFIASKLVNKQGEGLFLDIILGIIGAFVGGWLFSTFGMSGVSGVNLYSMLVAVVGAVVVLVIYHALKRRV
jgi:uncharacterized membrane protein YeaQ/YmgE (transglycosylase-associated protein family)